MPDRTCPIDGCSRLVRAKSWCQAHYMRWYHHGDPLAGRSGEVAPSPPVKVCTVDGCDRVRNSRGLCNAHYLRLRKHGTPGGVLRPTTREALFWSKVEVGDPASCWPWTAAKRPDGYGSQWWGDKSMLPHRIAYQLARGPIPDRLVLDHTCHNESDCPGGRTCPHRLCMNPNHLEPVTFVENVMRGKSFSAKNARKTHCHHGHELTDDNVYRWNPNSRACRTCMRAAAE